MENVKETSCDVEGLAPGTLVIVKALLCLCTLLILRLQFRAKLLERICQRTSAHDGPERNGTHT